MVGKKYFILLCCTLPFLFAKESNRLSLSQALHMVKNQNIALKIARFNTQMKAYELKMVQAKQYGKLDVKMTGMRSNDAGNIFGFKVSSREATFGDFGLLELTNNRVNDAKLAPQALNEAEARNHYQTTFVYELPLYTGGRLTEYKRLTQAMMHMSQLDTRKLLNEKIFQVKKVFYDISLVQHYIYNLSKIKANIVHLQKIVKSMKKEGYAQEIDVLEVQARQAEVESMYNQASLNRDLAYQFLSFLLDREVISIKHVKGMAKVPRIHFKRLEAQNIDIQKARLGLEMAQMQVGLQESAFLPTLGAFGEYGSADDKFANDFKDKDSYTVGIQVSWNLFNGGGDSIALEKAKVNRLKVQSQLDLVKKGMKLKVKKLRTEILSIDNDIRSLNKQLKFARKVYESYQNRYKEGLSSISDVLIKQSKQLEILLKLLSMKNQHNTKVFELNAILNKGGNV